MAENGFVTIVGAGPGDLGLMTLAGCDAIQRADAVVYDRKVVGEIQCLVPPGAEVYELSAIKEANEGRFKPMIAQLILDLARAGKRVVRLKAGDPNLFAREDKEVDMLRDNAVPYRVVPGVTSALAAPVYAGVPITHSEYTNSLHLVAARDGGGKVTDIRYRELAASGGTLVFLMAAPMIRELCRGLLDAGMAPDTPAVVVEKGTMPRQRRFQGTLADMPETAAAEGVAKPAVLVVGAVSALADRYDWTGNLPLRGRNILVMASRDAREPVAERLREAGCGVDEYLCAAPRPTPMPGAILSDLRLYTWIVFTSRWAATAFFMELERNRVDIRQLAGINFAAIGDDAAKVLADTGIFAEYVCDHFDHALLSEAIQRNIRIGDRVLVYGNHESDALLAGMLRAVGVPCDTPPACEAVPEDPKGGGFRERLAAGEYDAVVFTDVPAVASLAELAEGLDLSGVKALCPGETVARAAEKLGMPAERAPGGDADAVAARARELFGNTN